MPRFGLPACDVSVFLTTPSRSANRVFAALIAALILGATVSPTLLAAETGQRQQDQKTGQQGDSPRFIIPPRPLPTTSSPVGHGGSNPIAKPLDLINIEAGQYGQKPAEDAAKSQTATPAKPAPKPGKSFPSRSTTKAGSVKKPTHPISSPAKPSLSKSAGQKSAATKSKPSSTAQKTKPEAKQATTPSSSPVDPHIPALPSPNAATDATKPSEASQSPSAEPAAAAHHSPASGVDIDVPLVNEKTQLRLLLPRQHSRYSLNQIYEFDHEPLGNRIPVILVPGRAEEFQQNSWWRAVYRQTHQDALYRHRFKTYLYLYNSRNELSVQVSDFAKELRKNFGKLPKNQPLMLVTYSLGGLITRDVLANDDILARVDTVIAIGVPFHGTPMFDPKWFNDYLNPPGRWAIRRFWDRQIYRAYMFDKSNLKNGMRWDNFDGSKPEFAENVGKDAGSVDPNSVVEKYTDYPNAVEMRKKMIIYDSYLENGYTLTRQPPNPYRIPKYAAKEDRGLTPAERRSAWLAVPGKILVSILPVYGLTVHSVFTYMNLQLANLSTFTPESPAGKNTHLYRFNDGAIPMSSALFLKPRPRPYNENFDELVREADARRIRIFANLDHTHMGEYSFFKTKLNRGDLLHPEDGVFRPNQWILIDLRNRLQDLPEKAQ